MKINNADKFFDSHERTGWKNDADAIEDNKKKVNNHDKVLEKSMEVLEGYAEQIALHLRVEQKQERHLYNQESHLKDQTKIFTEIRDFMRESK